MRNFLSSKRISLFMPTKLQNIIFACSYFFVRLHLKTLKTNRNITAVGMILLNVYMVRYTPILNTEQTKIIWYTTISKVGLVALFLNSKVVQKEKQVEFIYHGLIFEGNYISICKVCYALLYIRWVEYIQAYSIHMINAFFN